MEMSNAPTERLPTRTKCLHYTVARVLAKVLLEELSNNFLIEYFPSLSATKSHFVAQADSNLYNPPISASQVWELPRFTKLIFSTGIM